MLGDDFQSFHSTFYILFTGEPGSAIARRPDLKSRKFSRLFSVDGTRLRLVLALLVRLRWPDSVAGKLNWIGHRRARDVRSIGIRPSGMRQAGWLGGSGGSRLSATLFFRRRWRRNTRKHAHACGSRCRHLLGLKLRHLGLIFHEIGLGQLLPKL